MSKHHGLTFTAVLLCLLMGSSIAPAQTAEAPAPQPTVEQPDDPATEQQGNEAPAAALKATIIGVSGPLVQVRDKAQADWRTAEVGMVLEQGAEFRTGPRSKIEMKIPPDQVIRIDRLTEVKLIEAVQLNEQAVKTHVGMTRGRTLYHVSESQVEHNATLSSPSATHAVRGTQSFGLQDESGRPPRALAFNNEQTTFITPLGVAVQLDSQGRILNMDGDFNSLANYLFVNSNSDPGTARSRTEIEAMLVVMFQTSAGPGRSRIAASLGARGLLNDVQDLIRQAVGAGVPNGDTVATLTVINRNSDVDFRVIDAGNNHLCTFLGINVSCATSAAGGLAGPDLPAGGGTEWVVYKQPGNRPTGAMTLEANYFSGPATDVVLQLKVAGNVIGQQTVNVGPSMLSDSAVLVVPVGFPDGQDELSTSDQITQPRRRRRRRR